MDNLDGLIAILLALVLLVQVITLAAFSGHAQRLDKLEGHQ